MFGYDEGDLVQAREYFEDLAAESRRESVDTRHVVRLRRQHRAARFMRSGVRVTWSAGRRVIVAFSPTHVYRI